MDMWSGNGLSTPRYPVRVPSISMGAATRLWTDWLRRNSYSAGSISFNVSTSSITIQPRWSKEGSQRRMAERGTLCRRAVAACAPPVLHW